MSSDPTSRPRLWTDVTHALRTNLLPGLVLWALACLVVGSYFLWDAARPVFDTLASWKAQGGFAYSIVATALFSGLIPWIVLRLLTHSRSEATWSSLLFFLGFWAYRGFEMDLFYRFQGWLFGTEPTLSIVASKVAFDMLVYNVFWATSMQLLAYYWKNHGFTFRAFQGLDWKAFFAHSLPVALVSTWLVWLPVVSLTYSLPPNLQIPVFNLAACFWALVVATLTRPKTPSQPEG